MRSFGLLILALLVGCGQEVSRSGLQDYDSRENWRTKLYRANRPAVVSIRVHVDEVKGEGKEKKTDRGIYIGSGFLVHPHGYILTNEHIVNHKMTNKSATMFVITADKKQHQAIVVATIKESDLAIIKIKREFSKRARTHIDYPVLTTGVKDRIEEQVGADVVTIGDSSGRVGSFAQGILSGVNRRVKVENTDGSATLLEGDFFQLSSLAFGGNSGGPVFEKSGEVIGIVTAGPMNESGGFVYAIPIWRARSELAQVLRKRTHKSRTSPGIEIEEIQGKKKHSVKVTYVMDDSRAAKAGIKVGDTLVSVDLKDGKTRRMNDPLAYELELLEYYYGAPEGADKLGLKVRRGGDSELKVLQLPLKEKKAEDK